MNKKSRGFHTPGLTHGFLLLNFRHMIKKQSNEKEISFISRRLIYYDNSYFNSPADFGCSNNPATAVKEGLQEMRAAHKGQ
jgi:hypothetical protein